MKIYHFLILLFLYSCNKTEDRKDEGHQAHDLEASKSNDITKEVMAIHDSIMPSMGVVMDLKHKISKDIKNTDSLLAFKATGVLKARKEHASALNMQLEKADEEMMGWMHQYNADTLTKLDEQKAAAYIQDQKEKIIRVRNSLQQSIKDAQLFIQDK